MFSDKEWRAWQSVSVSDTLEARIKEALERDIEKTKKVKRMRIAKVLVPAAACMLFVFAFLFGFLNKGDLNVYLNSVELSDTPISLEIHESTPAALFARKIEPAMYTVEFHVETDKKTEISTSNGFFKVVQGDTVLYTGNSFTTYESVNIVWTYPEPSEKEELELSFCSVKKNSSVIIVHDPESGSRTIWYKK